MQSASSSGLLKILFLFHLILSAWSMNGASGTLPASYLYYNLIFMAVLIWAMSSPDSTDSIANAFLVNVIIFILDVVSLTLYWPRVFGMNMRIFSAFAIANTVLRPISCLVLYRVFCERDTEGQGIRGLFTDVSSLFSRNGNSGSGYTNIPSSSQDSTPKA